MAPTAPFVVFLDAWIVVIRSHFKKLGGDKTGSIVLGQYRRMTPKTYQSYKQIPTICSFTVHSQNVRCKSKCRMTSFALELFGELVNSIPHIPLPTQDPASAPTCPPHHPDLSAASTIMTSIVLESLDLLPISTYPTLMQREPDIKDSVTGVN